MRRLFRIFQAVSLCPMRAHGLESCVGII